MAKRLPSDNRVWPSEANLRKTFPCLSLGDLKVPGIIVDSKGRILVWYLPGLIPEVLTVCLLLLFLRVLTVVQCQLDRAADDLEDCAARRVTSATPLPDGKTVNWRSNPALSQPQASERYWPGSFDYSVAHIGQGNVCHYHIFSLQ
jgi:hypothetical protein